MAIKTSGQAKAIIEEFAKVQEGGFFPCPRCGRMVMNEKPTRNALSRCAQVYICDECGTDEAMRAFARKLMPLEEWYIVRQE